MAALSNLHWMAIAALIVLYVASCVRVAARMRRTGRNGPAWFFITLFLTAIPSAVVLLRRRGGRIADGATGRPGRRAEPAADHGGQAGPPFRCPHCHALIDQSQMRGIPGARRCPNCSLAIDEAHLA